MFRAALAIIVINIKTSEQPFRLPFMLPAFCWNIFRGYTMS